MRPIALIAALAALLAAPAAAQQHDHGGGTPATAEAIGGWTRFPVVRTLRAERGAAKVLVAHIAASRVTVHPPQGESWAVPLEDGAGRFQARAAGNFHWVVAREERPGEVLIATAAQYFTRPGPAPAALLSRPMAELEVIPDPIPREHAHYRSGERWPFLVRFRGEPLAGARIVLQTGYGSRITAVTDAQGRAVVAIPDDMPEAVALSRNHHGRPPMAPMVLAVAHEAGGVRYLASFSDGYRPAPFSDRSVWPGLAFMSVGMIAAAPLLRRKAKEARR